MPSDQEQSSDSEQEDDDFDVLLKVKDNQWRVDPDLDTFDPSVGLPKHTSPARMRWDGRMEHDYTSYFNIFFPRRLIEHLAEWTNADISVLEE